jgi:hypothetical protein
MNIAKQIQWSCTALVLSLAGWAAAQQPAATSAAQAAPAAKLSAHVKSDIARHRAMALAHEGAARCLESGKAEADCLKELQAACKGLAIGKYCGMRHEH